MGDNSIVCNCVNGDSATADNFTGKVMANAKEVLWDVWRPGLATPPNCTGSFFRWNPREYKEFADSFATKGVLEGTRLENNYPRLPPRNFCYVQASFDGGCRENIMGAGVHIRAAKVLNSIGEPDWKDVLMVSHRIDPALFTFKPSASNAESFAATEALLNVINLLLTGRINLTPHCRALVTDSVFSKYKVFRLAAA